MISLHVIYRFTYDGKLEHTLGQLGVRGRGPNTFDRPTDIAWLPDGTYFISDGYGGTRVAKFDRNDKFLMDWGSAPKNPAQPGPSEFNTPHSIAISADRRVFVVDRGHQRMQVFDENGKFLDMWPLRSPTWPAEISTLVTNHIITPDRVHLGRRRGHEPNPQVRSERQLPLQLGRAGPASRPAELSARVIDGSGTQSLHRRLFRRPGAEIHAAAECGSRKACGPDSALCGPLTSRRWKCCHYPSRAPRLITSPGPRWVPGRWAA